MLKEADVKKILLCLEIDVIEHGNVALQPYARQIVSLANEGVELPLLNTFNDIAFKDALKNSRGNDFSLYCNGMLHGAKQQNDADLRAIGTAGVWQEKPDRAGWWARRKPNWNHIEVIQLVKEKIKPDDGVDTEVYQWYPIPEPHQEGK